MPDWFYRTLGRGGLSCLPDRAARAIALGVTGTLGRSSPGRGLIDLLGHMRADPSLAWEKRGIAASTRIGLGPWVDPEGRAARALARFGTGFIEIGPVAPADCGGALPTLRSRALVVPPPAHRAAAGVARWQRRLWRQGRLDIPLWIRLAAPSPGLDPAAAVQALESCAASFAEAASVFVVEGAPPDVSLSLPKPWLHAGERSKAGRDGSVGCVLDPVDGSTEATLARLRRVRAQLGPDAVLVVAGRGEPADLRALLEAGADLVEADAALVETGPGVLKRTNALLERPTAVANPPPGVPARHAWFWGAVLGLSLVAGGLITLILALGPVLLPYDERHLGISAETLRRAMPRVFDFMAHDRATLAGVMLGLGAFYAVLARAGVRRGQHWAQVAIAASAVLGFATFFSFLGFGYFDGLHAFVSAVLLQFTVCLMITRTEAVAPVDDSEPDERGDSAWLRCQWGQLLLVIHAAGLLVAGVTILVIGMGDVFVRTDLDFLCATRPELDGFNAELVSVVAHDRATLGGMLLASGVCQGLATLWGFARGRRWLWNALALVGLPAYAAALGIHLRVGYTSAWHLAPAFAGLALWAGGLALTADWLRAGRREARKAGSRDSASGASRTG